MFYSELRHVLSLWQGRTPTANSGLRHPEDCRHEGLDGGSLGYDHILLHVSHRQLAHRRADRDLGFHHRCEHARTLFICRSNTDLMQDLKKTVGFLSNTFRCRMHSAYIVRTPASVGFLWSIVKKFMEEETIRKISLYDTDKRAEPLF